MSGDPWLTMRDRALAGEIDDPRSHAVFLALKLQDAGLARYEDWLIEVLAKFSNQMAEHPEVQGRVDAFIADLVATWSAQRELIIARSRTCIVSGAWPRQVQ